MPFSKIWKPISAVSIITLLLVGYTNCSQPKVTENTQSVDFGSNNPTRLTLSPANKTVNWGATVQFSVMGGTPPFFFRVATGAGSISYYEGTFTAPNFDRASVIEVIDATGAVAQTNITTSFTASSALSLNYSSSSIHPGDAVTLTASGGASPYSYTMVSGVGTISGNTYTATSFGTGVIGVRDANGAQATFSVTVEPNLIVYSKFVYRHYHTSAQMYTYDLNASVPDWTYQTSFKVLSLSTYLNTVPLIRCFINSAQGRYLSTGNCSTYTNEGTLGYIYTYPAANTTPLYNCFKSSTGKYLISTNYSECLNNNFSVLGNAPMGYVPL